MKHRRLFRSPRAPLDADAELESFLGERIDDLVRRGMSLEDARQEALRRVGGDEAAPALRASAARRDRRLRVRGMFDDLRADCGFAVRALRRAPGWTAVVLLTIALGVAAATIVFTVADTLLLRPIRYPAASRVYVGRREVPAGRRTIFAPFTLESVRALRQARSVEDVELFSRGRRTLGAVPDTMTVYAAAIDTGFLSFAGARPVIGRNLVPHANEVLLAENFWRRQYGGSFAVLGKVIRVDSVLSTIVGVVPASLAIPDLDTESPDVWVLAAPDQWVAGVAMRLRPDVPPDVATQELTGILDRVQVDKPWWRITPARFRLTRPQDTLRFREALTMLTGAVLLLLLVACTNVVHLLLGRAEARQRELAVRYALGAGRLRLLRQLVTESVLLAILGGVLAVFVSWAGLRALTAARPASLVALSHVSDHRGVLSAASIIALGAGLAIGVVSGLRAAHRRLGETLRAGASTASPTRRRLRAGLVIGEVALSATLLVGALLLIHAVFDAEHMPLGFDARDLYTIALPQKSTDPPDVLRDRIAHLPGVEHVTVAAGAPSGFVTLVPFETPDRPRLNAAGTTTLLNVIEPDYFATMAMPLVAGHLFDTGSLDRHEAIVSTSMARLIARDGDALGRQFRSAVDTAGPWETVVGIVPDVVQDPLETGTTPAVYRPIGGMDAGLLLVIRMRGPNAAALLEPHAPAPVVDARQRIDQVMTEPRYTMLVLTAVSILGVVLAAIGLFGVISYSVAQRTREIGVRMAFGATRGRIAGLVVGEGVRLALAGIVLGLIGAVAATRLIQGVIHGVSRFDPFALGVGATVLLGVAVAACTAPMLRATAIDPVDAVRAD